MEAGAETCRKRAFTAVGDGTVITSALGIASIAPAAIAAAASLAVRLPRNLSGAASTLGWLGMVTAVPSRAT